MYKKSEILYISVLTCIKNPKFYTCCVASSNDEGLKCFFERQDLTFPAADEGCSTIKYTIVDVKTDAGMVAVIVQIYANNRTRCILCSRFRDSESAVRAVHKSVIQAVICPVDEGYPAVRFHVNAAHSRVIMSKLRTQSVCVRHKNGFCWRVCAYIQSDNVVFAADLRCIIIPATVRQNIEIIPLLFKFPDLCR